MCQKIKVPPGKKGEDDDGKHRGARRLVTNVTHERVPHSRPSFSLCFSSSSSSTFLSRLPSLRRALPTFLLSFGPFGRPLPGILISTFDVMPNTYPYLSGIRQPGATRCNRRRQQTDDREEEKKKKKERKREQPGSGNTNVQNFSDDVL